MGKIGEGIRDGVEKRVRIEYEKKGVEEELIY